MTVELLLESIDAEIAKWKLVRDEVTAIFHVHTPSHKAVSTVVPAKRKLSAKGRAAIKAAVKARWAKQKQAAK